MRFQCTESRGRGVSCIEIRPLAWRIASPNEPSIAEVILPQEGQYSLRGDDTWLFVARGTGRLNASGMNIPLWPGRILEIPWTVTNGSTIVNDWVMSFDAEGPINPALQDSRLVILRATFPSGLDATTLSALMIREVRDVPLSTDRPLPKHIELRSLFAESQLAQLHGSKMGLEYVVTYGDVPNHSHEGSHSLVYHLCGAGIWTVAGEDHSVDIRQFGVIETQEDHSFKLGLNFPDAIFLSLQSIALGSDNYHGMTPASE